MYNNDVTYDKKWETPENLAAFKKVEAKYFDKSYCSPSCPVAWAPEVLELLETLDRELGIRWNDGTIRAYYVQGNFFDWFFKSPVLSAWNTFRYHFVDKKTEYYRHKTFFKKLGAIADSFFGRFAYGKNAFRVVYVAPLMNRVLKGKLTLSQLKEKYGRLTIYFSAPEAFDEWVDLQVRKCELKLALKGCYYPIETFWDAGVGSGAGTEYNPDTIISKEMVDKDGRVWYSVDKTTYRNLMKEMGLDLKEIAAKAEARKATKKADQP